MQCIKYIIIGVHLKPNTYLLAKQKKKTSSNTYTEIIRGFMQTGVTVKNIPTHEIIPLVYFAY